MSVTLVRDSYETKVYATCLPSSNASRFNLVSVLLFQDSYEAKVYTAQRARSGGQADIWSKDDKIINELLFFKLSRYFTKDNDQK